MILTCFFFSSVASGGLLSEFSCLVDKVIVAIVIIVVFFPRIRQCLLGSLFTRFSSFCKIRNSTKHCNCHLHGNHPCFTMSTADPPENNLCNTWDHWQLLDDQPRLTMLTAPGAPATPATPEVTDIYLTTTRASKCQPPSLQQPSQLLRSWTLSWQSHLPHGVKRPCSNSLTTPEITDIYLTTTPAS